MAVRYEPVRTESFNISSWIPMIHQELKRRVLSKAADRTEVCVRVRIAARWQIGIMRTKSQAG